MIKMSHLEVQRANDAVTDSGLGFQILECTCKHMHHIATVWSRPVGVLSLTASFFGPMSPKIISQRTVGYTLMYHIVQENANLRKYLKR